MKNITYSLLAVIMAIFTLASCSKDATSDGDDAVVGNATLKVTTRAQGAGTTDMSVALPINIYVFDAAGKCVGYESVSSEAESADFKLPEGAYTIDAVAGADASNYSLPTKDTALPSSTVTLKTGKAHGDIMCAKTTAVLTEGEDTNVALNMERKVFMLRNITINDVPDDVKSITAVIKPLYENITLSGEYTGENGKQTINMEKSDGGTWSKLCDMFLMKSVGNAVVEFSFLMADGKTRSFVYSAEKPLEANYKVDMKVNYLAVAEPTLKCSINGTAWNGETIWNIEIKERELINNGGGSTIIGDNVPAAGTIYKGCYVLKSEASEASGKITTVTLLAPKQTCSLTFTENDQESIRSAIDNAITTLAVEGISGWRLPTTDEISYIMDNAKDIDKIMTPPAFDQILLNTYNYFYLSEDNTIKAMNSSKTTVEPKSGRASYYVRPIATLVFHSDK